MADIRPFRALRYNLAAVGRLEDVATPPYDVIGPQEAESYRAASPYNMVRLELSERMAGEQDATQAAVRAAESLRAWRGQGVLARDPRESLYYCETDYEVEGQGHCRRGFTCLVRAEEFGGSVRRHEMTFSRVKADRLRLIQECRANLSPVFGLYDDPPDRAVQALAARVAGRPPEFSLSDRGGCRHRLWRVDEPAALSEAASALRESLIVVADGHHRYETAVIYGQQMRARFPQAPESAAFNHVMMYLANSQDAGLSVLPAHRLLATPAGFSLEGFERQAAAYFDLKCFPQGGEAARRDFLAALHTNGSAPASAIGLYAGGGAGYLLLRLKEGVMSGPLGRDLPEPLRRLDVVVFARVVLQRLLGLPGDEDERLIEYVSDTGRALESAAGSGRLAFLLNATPVAQVQEVARHRLTMPRKSTYFYPKVMSGLTIHPLDYPPEV